MNTEPDSSASEPKPAADASASRADVGAMEAELAVQKDQYLRLAADFDNFRKRTARETERGAAAQKEALIRELLP